MIELPSRRLPYSKSSAIAQGTYVSLVLIEVVLTVGIAAIALTIVTSPSSPAVPAGFAAVLVLFILSFAVRLYSSSAHFDRKWYAYRAVAESMKTLSWQFATGAGEFPLDDKEAERNLRGRLTEVESHCSFPPHPSTISEQVDASIPGSMTKLRSESWEQRRDVYIGERVDDQIRWYRSKGQKNAAKSSAFSWVVTALQVSGILLAVALLAQRTAATLGVSTIAFLAVLISSFIAWTQVKQYSELVEPYLNALGELNQLRVEIVATTNEPAFLKAVTETELAISREHTMWLAKRGMYGGVRTR